MDPTPNVILDPRLVWTIVGIIFVLGLVWSLICWIAEGVYTLGKAVIHAPGERADDSFPRD